MEIQLTPDQEAFVRSAIASGLYQNETEVVRDAMSHWEERQRRRLEILAAVNEAEGSFGRGEGRRVTTEAESLRLADEIKQRGLARVAAKR
ncbi:MAG: hypothetical protein FJW32_18455 [Acidobacteria bacterium]|nr:hypothetical protein [Acidobacteriota bacterium]